MGPKCPHCLAIYEWTEAEIQEPVFCPKVYFCSYCFQMFILDGEEITRLQEDCRRQLGDLDN